MTTGVFWSTKRLFGFAHVLDPVRAQWLTFGYCFRPASFAGSVAEEGNDDENQDNDDTSNNSYHWTR